MDIKTFEERLELIKGKVDTRSDRECAQINENIKKAENAIEELMKLHEEMNHWKALEDRVIGHVVYAPPITHGADPGGYTEDFALVEIDTSRFDASNVKINCIDLGTKIGIADLKRMMSTSLGHTFHYPPDRLLPLCDTIPVEDMRKPTMLDQNGDHCIVVLKRGRTSGLTVGRASGIDSYVRTYHEDAAPEISRGRFWRGRIGGLLTGGDGYSQIERLDLTYATPVDFLLKRIKAWKGAEEAHVNPQFY